jgi:TolB-like protein
MMSKASGHSILSIILTFLAALSFAATNAQIAGAPGANAKPSIAILTLKSANEVTPGETELLTDRLAIEIFNTGKFQVMERNQIEQIMKEQGFQQSGSCTDEGCVVQLGKMLGVQQLVSGSLGKLGRLYMINLRCIDVKTAKIIQVVSEDIKGDIEDVVQDLPTIAAKLAGLEAPARHESVRQENREEEKPSQPPQEPRQPTFDKPYFLEAVHYTKDQLGFNMTESEYQDMNKDASEKLLDGLNKCFDDNVSLLSQEEVSALPACKSVIIRVTLNSYKTEPDARKQVHGIADVILSFYEGSKATTPAFRIQIIKQGDRHWGDATPFVNAYDAIGGEIEDNLDKQDYIRKLQKRMR